MEKIRRTLDMEPQKHEKLKIKRKRSQRRLRVAVRQEHADPGPRRTKMIVEAGTEANCEGL